MTPLLKNLLVVLGLGLLILLAVYLYLNNDRSVLSRANSDVSTQALLETQDFLRRLQQLRTVQLDDSLLLDTNFRSLEDFSVEPVAESVGRENPFDPIQ